MLDTLLAMAGIDRKSLPTEEQINGLIAELREIPNRITALEKLASDNNAMLSEILALVRDVHNKSKVNENV